MIKKALSGILVISFFFLIGCSDSSTNTPTPPNVTLSNLSMTWDTSMQTVILALVDGTATNTGQTAALNVQVQLQLLDANKNVLGSGTWVTIFNTLNSGSSLGFTVNWWFNTPCAICNQAKYYQVKVQWSNNAVEYESGFEGLLSE